MTPSASVFRSPATREYYVCVGGMHHYPAASRVGNPSCQLSFGHGMGEQAAEGLRDRHSTGQRGVRCCLPGETN
eukprot:7091-Eustigmatos_ZCMA.PRE.1